MSITFISVSLKEVDECRKHKKRSLAATFSTHLEALIRQQAKHEGDELLWEFILDRPEVELFQQ